MNFRLSSHWLFLKIGKSIRIFPINVIAMTGGFGLGWQSNDAASAPGQGVATHTHVNVVKVIVGVVQFHSGRLTSAGSMVDGQRQVAL